MIWQEFKHIRNQLATDTKRAKEEYYARYFTNERNDPQKVWRTVKNLAFGNTSPPLPTEVTIDSVSYQGSELANIVNNHFVNVGATDNADSSLITLAGSSPESTVYLYPATVAEVEEILRGLDNSLAAGTDDLKVKPIKHILPLISDKLCYLCNNILETGTFPSALKIAKVTLISKGGDESDLNNYRPISVLPLFSKVVEKILNNRLSKFLLKKNIITNAQYGFQKGKSTESALTKIRDQIVKNIEDKLYTIGVFLDLRKAFDSIQHDILLRKCYFYGLRGKAHELIKSYLSERLQYVKLHGYESNKLIIKYGVPQGSILGPLLFLLYINDIVSIPNTPDIILYADDTNIFFSHHSLSHLSTLINSYLEHLSGWLASNQLKVNVSKTKFIIFRPINKASDPMFSLCINGMPLEQVYEIKFLGVWFHENLSWNTHVCNLTKQLSKVIGAISRIRRVLPRWLMRNIYYGLVHSKLYYCLLVWGNTSANNLGRLHVLQRRAVRLLTNADFFTPSRELFSNAHILTVRHMFILKLGIHVHREVKENRISLSTKTVTYRLRDVRRYTTPRVRTNYGYQSMAYLVPQFLNKFAYFVKPEYTQAQFTRLFRSYLDNNYGITLIESDRS